MTTNQTRSKCPMRGTPELLRAVKACQLEKPEFNSVHSAKWTGQDEITVWLYPSPEQRKSGTTGPMEWVKLTGEKAEAFQSAYLGEYHRLNAVARESTGKFWRGEE